MSPELSEAETLLQQAERVLLSEPKAPAIQKQWLAGLFVKLYEAWGKPDQAALWRTKRDAISTLVPSASTTKTPDGK